MTLLVVAAALIDRENRILLAKRPEGKNMAGLWEFPGGKVEAGENPEGALCRELEEELSIQTKPACLSPFTFASHPLGDDHLLMPLYFCRKWSGFVQPREGQEIRWVKPRELRKFEMPPADLPLVAMIEDFFLS